MKKFSRNKTFYVLKTRAVAHKKHSIHAHGWKYMGMLSYIRKFIKTRRMANK